MKKKALYLSVNVFSTKVLIGDTIFTSPNGDGTAILRGHPSHAKVSPLAEQRKYLHFSVILRPWVIVRPRKLNLRPPALQSNAVPTKLILPQLKHTKTNHRLLSIGTATSNRRHARYLSDHSPFLGGPGNEIGKTIPTQSSQGKVLELPTCPSLPFLVIMSTQEVREEALVIIRCIVKGYYHLPFWGERRWSVYC